MKNIAITGTSGNLGNKLISFLIEQSWCDKIISIDKIKTQENTNRRGPKRTRFVALPRATTCGTP